MAKLTLTDSLRAKLEAEWWKQEQGDLNLADDEALDKIIDSMLAYANDQLFGLDGTLNVENQMDAEGNLLETVDEDEMARRIVHGLAVILYGGS